MSVSEAFREQQIYLKKNEHLIKPHTFLKFEVEMPFSMKVLPISKWLYIYKKVISYKPS